MNAEETDLFVSLLKFCGNDVSIPEFPRLNENFMKTVSKDMTKLIYDSYKTENDESTKNRFAIIDLLRKWSQNPKLITNLRAFDSCLMKCYKADCLRDFDCKIDKWDMICNEVEEMHKRSRDKIRLIRELDNEKLRKTNFVCKSDLEDEQVLVYNKKTEPPNKKEHNSEIIKLGYSLLNLDRTSKQQQILTEILERTMSSEMNRTDLNFVQYASNFPEFSELIFTNCKFLYEKPILRMSTSVLRNESVHLEGSELDRIIELCRSSRSVTCDIKLVLYEVFALSGFDESLSVFVRTVLNKCT